MGNVKHRRDGMLEIVFFRFRNILIERDTMALVDLLTLRRQVQLVWISTNIDLDTHTLAVPALHVANEFAHELRVEVHDVCTECRRNTTSQIIIPPELRIRIWEMRKRLGEES